MFRGRVNEKLPAATPHNHSSEETKRPRGLLVSSKGPVNRGWGSKSGLQTLKLVGGFKARVKKRGSFPFGRRKRIRLWRQCGWDVTGPDRPQSKRPGPGWSHSVQLEGGLALPIKRKR